MLECRDQICGRGWKMVREGVVDFERREEGLHLSFLFAMVVVNVRVLKGEFGGEHFE